MQKLGTKSAVVSGVIGVLAASTVAAAWMGGAWANGVNDSSNAGALRTGARLAQGRDRDNKGERHPELRRALRSLRAAKADLQKGAHDFAGHREKALDLTDHAIAEIETALKVDRK